MRIKIEKLTLVNFQGLRTAEFEFSDMTNFFGANGTYKTTLANSFTWLLFGKNTQDQQQFEVKTLDANNVAIPKLNHEVEAVLNVDGATLVLKRVLKEKWTKKRGTAKAVFDGNTEDFFIDEVPVNKSEYQQKINNLIKESRFKLLSNPLYLNGVMDWRQRRDLLIDMAGMVTLDEVAGSNKKYLAILPEIKSKSIPGYLKMIASKKRNLKDQLKEITPRIDEVSRSIPEMPNVEALNKELGSLETELGTINGNLEAITKAANHRADELRKLNKELTSFESSKNHFVIDASTKAQQASRNQEAEQNRLQGEIEKLELKKKNIEEKQVILKELIDDLVKLRREIKEETYKLSQQKFDRDSVSTHCPTCSQKLPDANDKILELEENFNKNNDSDIKANIEKSQKHLKKINELQSQSDEHTAESKALCEEHEALLEKMQIEISKARQNYTADYYLKDNADYNSVLNSIKEKEKAVQALIDVSISEDEEKGAIRQQEIVDRMKVINTELGKVQIIKDKEERVKELERQEKNLSEQIAEYEGLEFLTEQFNKDYINGIEARVNSKFPGIKFRMFKRLVNGGEEEDCTLLYGGVPYSDLNNAARIQTGLMCINAICKHYNYSAPIWVDNAESVIELPIVDSQLIRLVVSAEDKELRIVNI